MAGKHLQAGPLPAHHGDALADGQALGRIQMDSRPTLALQRTRPRPSASKAAIPSAWLAEATIEAHQADQQAHQGLLGQKN